jgi:hypothetical protein
MRLATTTRQAGSVTIVDISGRIILGQETASLRNLVTELLSKRHNKILFNFAYVDMPHNLCRAVHLVCNRRVLLRLTSGHTPQGE